MTEGNERILGTGDQKTGEVTSRINEIMDRVQEGVIQAPSEKGDNSLEDKLKDYKFEIQIPRDESSAIH